MANAKTIAEIIMRPLNIWIVSRSIATPRGKSNHEYCHISCCNKSNFFCRSFKSAIALFEIRIVTIKIIKTLLQNTRLNKRINFVSIKILMIFAINFNADAKDFGIKGHTYQIIEQPFLRMIDERLQKVDMKKEQEKMTVIVKDRVLNPKAVEGLLPATKSRVFYFDPTYTLEEDAVLPCGKILHKAGTKVNPLEHMDLNRRLFFIDSRQAAQVKWLKAQLTVSNLEISNNLADQKEPIEDRIILVGGSVFKLKEELGKEHENKVYFDQHGELTTKFGIKSSPAVALQEGLRLIKIEEIKLLDKEENKIDKLNKPND